MKMAFRSWASLNRRERVSLWTTHMWSVGGVTMCYGCCWLRFTYSTTRDIESGRQYFKGEWA